jgi:phenylacetate-coenzyme A ligase PaaK-like adenylate-forming protein
MTVSGELKQRVFNIKGDDDFNSICLDICRFQYETNPVVNEFSKLLGIKPSDLDTYEKIPFLPVSLFKDHEIISGDGLQYEKVFTSSGTTGSIPSKHFIRDLSLYRESFTRTFRMFYGDPSSYLFLALLPGYLERQGSSLVYMTDCLIKESIHNGSGFFLDDLKGLHQKLKESASDHKKTILLGASFALLDFAEQYPMDLGDAIIMETGGMKGRRREMIREELHEILCRRFNVEEIHSEYGMTELLSQAYSAGNGIYRTPPWMKVLIRDTNDPLSLLPVGQTGGINIIDLANIYSCSFIATQDLGRLHDDGSFEVLGRFDDSDVRGCNLLVV